MKRSAPNLTFQYLKFLFRSKGIHGIHSPFLFELVQEVKSKDTPSFFEDIERIRKMNLNDNSRISVTDYGAGSGNKYSTRTIQSIARKSLKPIAQAQQLYKICSYFKPSNIIELGTSLGVTTLYLSQSSKQTSVFTFEGDPEIIKRAKKNIEEFGANNIQIIEGNMNESLSNFMTNSPLIDVAFLDGNHQKAPTLEYFAQLISKAHNDTLFIFDDIHWSDNMEEAWKEIKQNEKVTLTVDTFHFGLVFIKKELSKQHLTIRL